MPFFFFNSMNVNKVTFEFTQIFYRYPSQMFILAKIQLNFKEETFILMITYKLLLYMFIIKDKESLISYSQKFVKKIQCMECDKNVTDIILINKPFHKYFH